MVEKVWSHRRSTFEEQQGMSLVVVARVELTAHHQTCTYIIKQLPVFSSLLNQIEPFLCHWTPKLEGDKCSLSVRSEGAKVKTQDEDEW